VAAAQPLQFGFGVFPYSRFSSPSEILETAVLGDQLGFDAITLPEHLLPPLWPRQPDLSAKYWFDLPTLAGWIASATTSLRLLTSVLVVPYHPPVQLAKALATVDVLSKGRLWCGVGTGWMAAEFRRLGISFEQRGDITDHYLRAMRELWTADAPHYESEHISFSDVSFYPRPVQKPHPPFFIGGTGERPFRRIAELGDGWFPMTATIDGIRHGVDRISALMAALDRDPSELWVGYTGIGIGTDERVGEMRRHAGDTVEKENPISSADEAIDRIARYREAGVTFVSVGTSWSTAAELQDGLRWFAAEVLPAFRDG
jgi:probable F420-dependent oxidoreductase